MSKVKRIIIIAIISLLVLGGVGFWLFNIFVDENSLSIDEKKWIDANNNNVISLSIPNDLPVFGSTGAGVFFDFSNSLKQDLGLNINDNTVSYLSKNDGYGFAIKDEYDANNLLLYKDHFVLVSREAGLIDDIDTIPALKPSVLNTSIDKVAAYFDTNKDNFVSAESYTKITEGLGNGTIKYALVPLNEYKDELIANNINVLAHVSDLNRYYYLNLGNDENLNSIITKHFNSWKEKSFKKSYNENNYKLFINTLNISEADEDTLTSKAYKYGFAEIKPYEVLSNKEYGGIIAAYLHDFSEFANVEFIYKKYNTANDLAVAALEGNIDLYYNYYNLVTNFVDSGALRDVDYYVIADNDIELSLDSLNGLKGYTVNVLKDSYIYDELSKIDGIVVETYDSFKELKRLVKKDNIIVLDDASFDYYINNISEDYSVRYRGRLDGTYYTYRYANGTDTFYKLFGVYMKTLDPKDLLNEGISSYIEVQKSGRIVTTIAIIVLILVGCGICLIFYYRKKIVAIKLNTKVKKDDRLKYIDLLTSLKNRNYYNEKLDVWNKNTIYPQACIVMDINNLKELNDTLGHEEGDKLIQAVANVLIKLQLDNTEVIRTDGDEFMIYTIGYSEKQILSYIKKLMKEFDRIKYEYGISIGFSMIEDDTKLVEDAFNDACVQMRKNKMLAEVGNDKKE